MSQDKPLTETDQKIYHPFKALQIIAKEVHLLDRDLGAEMDFAIDCLFDQIENIICET